MRCPLIARHTLFAIAVASVALASCGQPISENSYAAQVIPTLRSQACYETKQSPVTVTAQITFYGWPDNTPPGNAIAHPVIHRVASGDGTWCNPTTFATEPSNDRRIPYGMKIYVPYVKQYFVREDDCTPSGPSVGSGNNGCYQLWFDLWIGGDANSKTAAVVDCENRLTYDRKVQVILNPKSTMPVAHAGAIYQDAPPPNGTCH